MSKDNRMVRVGDMLVTARIVSSADITEAIQLSKRLGTPIGRVLITSGCVTEKILHAALDLQSLIRDGELPLESALKALCRVDKTGCTVKEALEHLNFHPKYGKGNNNLADLLVDSNLVSQEQIDEALQTSFEYGTPLGSTLVFQGALSPDFFPSISAIQERVTNGELSNEQAIDELQAAFTLWLKAGDRTNQPALKTIDELSDDPGTHIKRHLEAKATSNPRAHEGEQKKEPVPQEEGKSEQQSQDKSGKKSLDNDIVESQKQSEISQTGDSAEQRVTGNQSIENTESKERREKHDQHARRPSQAALEKNLGKEKRPPATRHSRAGGRLVDLLSAAGLLDQDDLPAAYQLMLQDTHRSATFLVEAGLINDELRRQAERCHNLVRRGRLSPEQAIRALKSSHENELTFKEALSKEGVTQPVRLERDWQTGVAAGVVGGFLAAFLSLVITLFRLIRKG
ncbi:MAG: hypothetical protein IT342_12375 [Candidatus Melainabacteria bacterium]|nr:hypothetical protein [Candidatus Melainabacteria bacterium]